MVAFLLVLALGGCASRPAPDTDARVRHWIAALREPDAKLRKEAAFKLGNLGLTDPDLVVPALTGALKDTDAAVRREAILALVKCGAHAQEAEGLLAEMQRRDSDQQVRAFAGKALKSLVRDSAVPR
jgi:HEAT repeat protein